MKKSRDTRRGRACSFYETGFDGPMPPPQHVREKRIGRPPLGRDVHTWNPSFDAPLLTTLKEQATSLGISYGGYLLLVLAEAHDWHGQHLPDIEHPLPIGISVEELRARTQALTANDCRRTPRGPSSRFPVRADRELADLVNARARELDVLYSEYIRAIFREAAGDGVHKRSYQDPLLDIPKQRTRREEPLAS